MKFEVYQRARPGERFASGCLDAQIASQQPVTFTTGAVKSRGRLLAYEVVENGAGIRLTFDLPEVVSVDINKMIGACHVDDPAG